jgi:hypothetical protein
MAIPFSAYFEYVSRLGGKSRSEQADRWLIQTYTEFDPDKDFWETLAFMGSINGKNSALSVEMPCIYEGYEFDRIESVPGAFYFHFSAMMQEDTGKAMKLAIHTCYKAKTVGETEYTKIADISNNLSFHHAEILVKHFTSFFTQSRPKMS